MGTAPLASVEPSPASREPEHVVRVHIGRVEVKAVTPPARPPAPPARRDPSISLEAYLEERDRRRG